MVLRGVPGTGVGSVRISAYVMPGTDVRNGTAVCERMGLRTCCAMPGTDGGCGTAVRFELSAVPYPLVPPRTALYGNSAGTHTDTETHTQTHIETHIETHYAATPRILRLRYAISGTDLGYPTTRSLSTYGQAGPTHPFSSTLVQNSAISLRARSVLTGIVLRDVQY
eukprot:806892-Rhodomonas_salina.2